MTPQDRSFPGQFYNQVINNACGSIAILNAVTNFSPSDESTPEEEKFVLGEELENIKMFTEGMNSMVGPVPTFSRCRDGAV